MNAKQVFAAALIAVSGTAAFAQEVTQFVDTPSTLTRAEVKAELAQARADGSILQAGEVGNVRYDNFVQSQAVAAADRDAKSRAEVRAETRAYVRSHRGTINSYSPAAISVIGG